MSWFNSSFPSQQGSADYSAVLEEKTKNVPDCAICLEKVTDPVETNCGHVFDKHCITNWLSQDNNTCPFDRSNVKELKKRLDIFEETKCLLKIAVFSNSSGCLLEMEESVFAVMETVRDKAVAKYMKESFTEIIPQVKGMTIKGSFTFYPGKTLYDYQVMPGQETVAWLFLK